MLELFGTRKGVAAAINKAAVDIIRSHVLVRVISKEYTVKVEELDETNKLVLFKQNVGHLTPALDLLENLGLADVREALLMLTRDTILYTNALSDVYNEVFESVHKDINKECSQLADSMQVPEDDEDVIED